MTDSRLVVLVPYRPNGGAVGTRYRWLWDQVQPRLAELGPVYTGEPSGRQWSRAEAVNAASAAAGSWDFAMIGDCDTVPDAGAVRRAVAWVAHTGGAARPHGERFMLSQAGTMRFAQRGPRALRTDRLSKDFDRAHAGGGLLVLTRAAFDAVGGYDESFKGWGYEDTDMNLRLLKAVGWDRLPGHAYHLFHTREDNKPLARSKARYQHLLRDHRKEIAAWAADKGLASPEKVF